MTLLKANLSDRESEVKERREDSPKLYKVFGKCAAVRLSLSGEMEERRRRRRDSVTWVDVMAGFRVIM